MRERGTVTQASAGSQHCQAMAVAGNALLAPGALLRNQFANAILFVETRRHQRIPHQVAERRVIAHQCFTGQDEVALHSLNVVDGTAHTATGVHASGDTGLEGLDSEIILSPTPKLGQRVGIERQRIQQRFIQLRQVDNHLLIDQSIGPLGIIAGRTTGQATAVTVGDMHLGGDIFQPNLR